MLLAIFMLVLVILLVLEDLQTEFGPPDFSHRCFSITITSTVLLSTKSLWQKLMFYPQ
ncbi:MAG: hypothetical protein ACKO3V_09015 [Pirellula sp.]